MADDDDIVDIEDVASEPMFGDASDDAFTSGATISEIDLEQVYAEQSSVPREFGKTWEFDFGTGQFIKEGGRVATVTGKAAFAQWCMNVLHTERLTAAVYSDQIGVEFEPIVRSSEGAEIASLTIQSAVEEALAVHDRFDSISRFVMKVVSDIVYIDMTIKTTEGEVEVAGRIQR